MKRRITKPVRIAFACATATCLALGVLTAPALANSTVKVTLWDKGASAEMSTDRGMGMMHAGAPDSMMGVKLSEETVAAGEVTFEVTNGSKETVHEMIVVPAPVDGQNLPYDASSARFDEDKAGALGEVGELEAGKAGSLTLSLKPGKYVVSCNVANHYANGMWTILTVQ